jgi:predicted AlkP superfamily phosphohydrolase/phosphomutase
MEDGHLPFLKSITEAGTSGILRSSVPPVTPVAWTEFMTGCNPGKHGIFGFTSVSDDRKDFDLTDSTNIGTKTIWELLSVRGHSVVSLNLPMTYPPFEVNGIMVSGLFTPNENSDFTYPEDLQTDLVERGFSPTIREVAGKIPESSSKTEYKENIKQTWSLIEKKIEQARFVDSQVDWDVFCLQIQETDPIQHFLMGFMEKSHEWYDPDLRSYLLEEFYGRLDEALSSLVGDLGEDSLTLVISDHGFQTSKRTVYLGNWLHEQGFAEPSKTGNVVRKLVDIARRLDVFNVRRKVRWGKKVRHQKEFMTMDAGSSDVICAGEGYVGIAPLYVTAEGEHRERVIDDLSKQLREYSDPITGDSIIDNLIRREEIYDGPYAESAPDLLVEAASGYNFRTTLHPKSPTIIDLLSVTDRPGIHHREGILIASGSDVATATEVEADLRDIAPTLLHYLGEPVPEYMDGDVRIELFDESSHVDSEPRYVSVPPGRSVDSTAWVRQDEEDVMETLSDLGYID